MPAPATTEVAPELAARLRVAIMRVGRRLRQHVTGDVTQAQLAVLATLEHGGPMTCGEIAGSEGIQPPSVTPLVATLEERRYVTRSAATGDRRVAHITITDAGRVAVESNRRLRDAWLASRLGQLRPAELRAITVLLPVLERISSERP